MACCERCRTPTTGEIESSLNSFRNSGTCRGFACANRDRQWPIHASVASLTERCLQLSYQDQELIMSTKIRGSCLCGGIRFEVTPPFLRAGHCHCERCRKHSGTAVCTQARVPKEQFRLLRGADLIQVYGKGEGAVKAFCRTCGSSIFGGDWPDGSEVSIRMGAFDDDPGI